MEIFFRYGEEKTSRAIAKNICEIRKINGILPMLISAKQNGYNKFIIPVDNAMEAAFIDEIEVYPVSTLKQVVAFLKGEISLEKNNNKTFESALK